MEMMKRVLTALFFCVAACSISLHLGQDTTFDLKSYHLYNAWAVLTGRWSHDVFVAGAQTFFSPFIDAPYYIVATTLLPAHGVAVVAFAGIPYGILLYLIYLISRRIGGALQFDARWERTTFVAASVLLAGTGAATWSQIGLTSNDVTVAAIVLASFYQILSGLTDHDEEPLSFRKVAVAGALLGLATGLKLTAAIYVPSIAVVIFFIERGWKSKVRSLFVYGCCTLAAFAIAYGPWGWKLYKLTGNPFFPLFNGVFHSDWMASISIRDVRFLPKSLLQWLFYPFYWTNLQSSWVTEVPFRDVRLALAYVFVVGYVVVALISRDLRTKFLFGKYKAIHALVLFIAFSYILWMHEFSILRYLVAVECLASLFVVVSLMVLAQKLRHLSVWFPAIGTTLAVGFIVAFTVSPPWGRAPAGMDILAMQAPGFEHGALVIFADVPMSFLAPGLAATGQDLRFMTIPRDFSSSGGQLGADGFRHELGRRMKVQIHEHREALYVLFYKSDARPESSLAAFNVQIDMSSCQTGKSPLEREFLACRGIYREEQPSG
ncbi:hypothetical protein [Dokdonella soli]